VDLTAVTFIEQERGEGTGRVVQEAELIATGCYTRQRRAAEHPEEKSNRQFLRNYLVQLPGRSNRMHTQT